MTSDILQVLRRFSSKPGFFLLLLLLVATGVSLQTLSLSVTRSVLGRPLPFADPERLVVPWGVVEAFGVDEYPFSWPNYEDYRDLPDSPFVQVAASRSTSFTLAAGGAGDAPHSVQGARVTHNLLQTLGITPALGADFPPQQQRPPAVRADPEREASGTPDNGGAPSDLALISHRLWREHFQGSPTAVGATIRLDDVAHVVVGVLPPGTRFPNSTTDILVPLIPSGPEELRAFHFLRLVGRLDEGAEMPAAEARLRTFAKHLRDTYPDDNQGLDLRLVPLLEQTVGGSRRALQLLLSACVSILVLSCLTVAGLLVASTLSRSTEIGLRKALGSDGWRVARPFLLEGAAVATLGGTLGVVISAALLPALRSIDPRLLPRAWEVAFDLPTALGAATTMLLAGLAFSFGPVRLAQRQAPASLLGATRGSGRSTGRRLRRTVVCVQVAVALPLLFIGILLLRHVSELRQVELGFEPEQRVVAGVALPRSLFQDATAQDRYVRLALEGLSELPGVEAAGMISRLPLSAGNSALTVGRLDVETENPPNANYRVVAPGTLEALGIDLLEGRDLRASDGTDDPPVVIVNDVLARRLWQDGSPIGLTVRLGALEQAWRVIGVTRSARLLRPDEDPEPTVWVSVPQNPFPGAVSTPRFVVRAQGDPKAHVAPVRDALRQTDPDRAILDTRPMSAWIDDWFSNVRVVSLLIGVLAAAALLLSTCGLYGVLAFFVAESRGELAIRSAMGARPWALIARVVTEGLLPVGTGAALGVGACGLLATTPAADLQVRPYDLPNLALVTAIFGVAALLATWLPARRAVRQQPAVLLRES